MTLIKIPCTRFSARIIAAEYGTAPVQVRKRHPLFRHIRPAPRGFELPPGNLPLDACFGVECTPRLAGLLTRFPTDAGSALFRFHTEQMIQFAYSRSLAGIPVMTSIKFFYELYNIGEDDLELMSAYKAWQRWAKKNGISKGKPFKKPPASVLPKCTPADFRFPPPPRELQRIVDERKNELYARRPGLPSYLYRQVSIFLFFEIGRLNAPTIASRFGLHIRTVYKSVSKVRGYLSYDEELYNILLRTTQGAKAAPIFA